MSKPQDRTVYRNSNGEWVNKKNSNSQATSLHKTQQEAYEAARKNLAGVGGEISIKGINGKIREKNTIAPGNDDFPPKG